MNDIEFKNEVSHYITKVISACMITEPIGPSKWAEQAVKIHELIDRYIMDKSKSDTQYVLQIQHLDECNDRQQHTIESQLVELQDLNCRNENQARIIKDVKASRQGMSNEIQGLKRSRNMAEFEAGQGKKLARCRGRQVRGLQAELKDMVEKTETRLASLRDANREIKKLKEQIDRQVYMVKSSREAIKPKNEEARNLRKQITTFGVEIGNLEATVQVKDEEIEKLKECLVNCHKDMDTKAAHIEKLRWNAVEAGKDERKRIVDEISSAYFGTATTNFGTATTNGDRINILANNIRSCADPLKSIRAESAIRQLECYARQQELLVLERDMTIRNHKNSIKRRGDVIESRNKTIHELKVKNAKDFRAQQRKLTEGSLSDRLAASHEVADELLTHYDIVDSLKGQLEELKVKGVEKSNELLRRYDVITKLENDAIDHRKELSQLNKQYKELMGINAKWAQQNVGLKKVVKALMVNIMVDPS